MKKSVVVTGVGPVCSLGIGRNDVLAGLEERKTGLSVVKYKVGRTLLMKYYKHLVSNFDLDNFDLRKDVLNEINLWKRNTKIKDFDYLIGAIYLALMDGELKYNSKSKMGIILAHENIGFEEFCKKIFNFLIRDKPSQKAQNPKDIFDAYYSYTSRDVYEMQTFMPLYHVTKLFDVHGYSLFINNACSSGLYAIEVAADIIRSGVNDVVIVAASDCQDIFKVKWLRESGLYSLKGKIKPFDVDRDGFVSGEGATALILEDRSHAEKRGAMIYAEYLGGSFNLEGWKIAYPRVTGTSYKDVIRETLRKTKSSPGQIDLISVHGVGSQVNDQYEAEALVSNFGNNFLKPRICALKPYVGHNLGNSALLETAIAILIMQKGKVPSVLNTKRVDAKLRIRLPSKTEKITIKRMLKISNGFAGYNGACLFNKVS